MATTFDQYYPAATGTLYCEDGGERTLAQTFTASETYDITEVTLRLLRKGSPATVRVTLWATSGGVPTGNNVAIFSFNGNTLTTDAGGEDVVALLQPDGPSASVRVNSGSLYAIRIWNTALGTANGVGWRLNNSGGYANGDLLLATNGNATPPTWASQSPNDALFKVAGHKATRATGSLLLVAQLREMIGQRR